MTRDRAPSNPLAAPFADLFDTIEALVMCHSPSGDEGEVDRHLAARLKALGAEPFQDGAGNVIVKLAAADRSTEDGATDPSPRAVAITAHKDEIGAYVKTLGADGRVFLRRLGGAFPWVYGEGPVDLLGDRGTVTGILSFGSRHVSHESPQKAQQDTKPLTWEDAWVDTFRSPEELAALGIRPGSRAVVGKHRKAPLRLGDRIASYTLDNKASIAILLGVIAQKTRPAVDTYLVFSAKEEVGALGAMHFCQRQRLDALVALEICPIAPEYPVLDGPIPVLLSKDGYGLYDDDLNRSLQAAADRAEIPLQMAAIDGFGSDATIAMKFGCIPRGACLSFPTHNTHGYEIAHLGAIAACIPILCQWIEREAGQWRDRQPL
jgi:putative aminopeptidase FrvX